MKPIKLNKNHAETLAESVRHDLKIAALEGKEESDVVEIFRTMKFKGREVDPITKCNVFWELDSGYMKYHDHNGNLWHSLLRRTRNHYAHGKALFELFR